jgi:electron transfer flavoprotein beta subunit
MNIIVCVKQVPDPEAPAEDFKLDPDGKQLIASSKVNTVINPFDDQAVEAALRIKDKSGAKVTILSYGKGLDVVVAKKPLLMGADELVLLDDQAFADGGSWSTVHALALAAKKIGHYDLILCGRQASDWNAGQVGLGLAEVLGLPSVSRARKVELADGKVRVERVITNGYETVEVILPSLVTVSNELGQPRYPSIRNMGKANRIQPVVWTATDIGFDPSDDAGRGQQIRLLDLFQPVFDAACEIIKGETPEEAAEGLALRLREERIV